MGWSVEPPSPDEFHVYVYTRTLEAYEGRLSVLADEVSSFGFTDVYLSVRAKNLQTGSPYWKTIARCNAALHGKGVRVHALLLQDKYAYIKKEKPSRDIGSVLRFNTSSEPETRFDGLTFDLEPHIMKRKYGIPNGFPAWDREKNYGIGRDNDRLLKRTLEILEKAKKQIRPSGLLTSEAVGHFFHDRWEKGDLSEGSVDDFLEAVDFVIIMDYADSVRLLKKHVGEEIRTARRPRSVIVCLKTKSNPIPGRDGRGEETTFWEEGWGRLQKAIEDLNKEFGRHRSFRGIGIFEFDSYRELSIRQANPRDRESTEKGNGKSKHEKHGKDV